MAGSEHKKYIGVNVLDATRQRISWVFDNFPRIYVSFSGGKDSTVMLHLVMDEAIKRSRKVGVLFVDLEAQYKLTIDHVRNCYEMYQENIEPYWCALPLGGMSNAVSMYQPEWCTWEHDKEADWVRLPDPLSITDENLFPFYHYGMDFEDFIVDFGHWYSQGKLTACFVGIRTGESLNRWRTIAGHGVKWDFDGKRLNWTNYVGQTLWNIYPLYDWTETDIWAYHGKTGKAYNKTYDLMYKAGLSLHQMRLCQPYGKDQRKGLWLFHLIEPETWARIVSRVNGANSGAIYAQESGNILGNIKITKPEGHTWKSFAELLLNSLPPQTRNHYENKIAVFLHWWRERGYNEIPDFVDPRLEAGTDGERLPSWRRIAKTLLTNDYWCKRLSFSPTKNTAYNKYLRIMKQRRARWNILSD